MKQATNPFAPVSLWRKRLPGYAAMGAATVAMAVGLIAMQHARTTVAGTLLQVSEADAAAYGISAVYQLDNGSYRVEGSQKGFQSDVQAAVTIDAEGNVSAVEILSQDETENLGSQCVLAYKLAHNDAVGGVVGKLEQVAQHQRNGEFDQQRRNGTTGHILGHEKRPSFLFVKTAAYTMLARPLKIASAARLLQLASSWAAACRAAPALTEAKSEAKRS